MSFDVVRVMTSAAVATSGTVSIPYPSGKDSGAYAAEGHKAIARGLMATLALNSTFSLTFGTSAITFTYLGSTSIPAQTEIVVELNRKGANGDLSKRVIPSIKRSALTNLVTVSLGAPDVADADGVCASQSLNTGTNGTIAGALASGGVATFDVPRNVVAGWTNAAVITVKGTDEYGNSVVESSGSGTSLAGKKAFKTITQVTVSANVTGLTVGTGDVLGLPIFLAGTGHVLRELQDGAAPTAGTVVAGVLTAASATTGDVRGTYDPNAAADGAKAFDLVIIADDPTFKGVSQYTA